ncbi:MAG TPA: hypothetical protein VHO25_21220, partial [Polyangiaceae bacterium]|nr:hypothetical protein [Polyangiaceae bacterium]
NQVHAFTWDGLDRFGRPLQGKQWATVKHGYTYDAVYMRPPQVAQAFAQISGTPLSGNKARREVTLWNTTKHQLGGWFPTSDALGGWSLSEHHSYDPQRHAILRGDGEEEDPNDFLSNEVVTEAGTGNQGVGADGPDARASALASPGGVAAAPDGSFYIADTLNNRVRRVAADGTITTVVGDGTIGNLLVNPSNEAPIPTVNQIPGWTVVSGTTWQARSANPTAFEGTNYFYAGQVASGELRQDVNVSSFAPIIDAGLQDFTFEGRVRSFDFSPVDASRIVVEYRDANNQIVLASYDSGQVRQFTEWLQLLDTRFAPIGTRWIRVRLIATRFSGTNNDGYFDALSLRSGSDPQTTTPLSFPRGVAMGLDGSVYIADTNSHRIRKLDTNGMLSTVAGSGVAGFAGDNGPATTANLNSPNALTVAPDGALYIADTGNFRIRRVSTSGMISTVAGTGTSASSGNNGPARSAAIGAPEGIALMSDGTILISERTHHVVRSIASDGIIRAFAGTTSTSGFLGDGGLATAARLRSPTGLLASKDGRVFVADKGNHRIRVVEPSGIIMTWGGTGTASFGGEGGYVQGAHFNGPSAITQSSDGVFHVADTNNHRIRHVGPALPGFNAADLILASNNGSEVYHFNAEGLHQATLDALTGVALYTFGYDANNRLITITDHDNKVTQIDRDSSGQPTAIVGPYGQTTTLTLNPSGYLQTITDPEGQTHQLGYAAGGLLSHFTNPNGGVSELVYDSTGRLLTDKNAADATVTLARSESTNSSTVTRTTALGHATAFTTQDQPNGDQLRTTVYPDGTQAIAQRLKSGTTTTTLPNLSQITTQQFPHPLWGTSSPLTSQTTLLPSGLQRVETQALNITLLDPLDPFSIATRTETTTVNGRTTTTTYDGNTRTF